jgi:hypothetical protein
MNPQASWLSAVRAGGIFVACLLASYLLPFIAIYGHAFLPGSDFLFFFPQMAFPYDSVVVKGAAGQQTVFSPAAATLLSVLQWGLLTLGFSWSARRLKTGYMFLLAVAVIAAATFCTCCGVEMFGATVALDGT